MDQDKIQAFRDAEAQKKKEALEAERAKQNAESVANTIKTGSFLNSKASKEVKKAVTDSGDKVASTVEKVQTVLESGQDSVAQAINNLMLATVLTKDPKLAEAADNVASLLSSIADASDKFGKSSLNLLPVVNKELAKAISELAKSVREKQDANLTPEFDKVVEALNNLDIQPVVNVPQSEIQLDTQPIIDAIKALQKSIKPPKVDIPKTDFKDVISELKSVQKTISGLRFPVPNYVLPFKDSEGKATQVQLNSDGSIPITTGTGDTEVVGNVASGAADSGNPVKIGGRYNTTRPTLTDGQRGDLQLTNRGAMASTLYVANSETAVSLVGTNADAVAATATGSRFETVSRNSIYNGTTWDRQPGDTTGTYAVGNVASGVTDAGNPIKVGGKYNTTKPTLTDGQRGNIEVGTRGSVIVQLAVPDSSTQVAFTGAADAAANPGVASRLETIDRLTVFNGTTWDRMRGDATDGTLVNLGTNNDVSLNAGTNLIGEVSTDSNTFALADAGSNTTRLPIDGAGSALSQQIRNTVYNGSTWDRQRGDTNGTLVEQRFSYSRKTADGQVKASAGFVHSVSISPLTATPTAGLLTIYDNTTESGAIIYTEWVSATDTGHTIILDVVATTGIYVGFDGTLANVSCTVSYR